MFLVQKVEGRKGKYMHIFYAANNTPNSNFTIDSNVWRDNLYMTLRDLGHDVTEFDYDLKETFRKCDKSRDRSFISKNRPRVTRELLRQIKTAHEEHPIDLFFSYFSDACVLPEGISAISDLGVKTINWYCNGSYQFHLVEEISPYYDWCLVPERFRLKDYVSIGANPIYCQEAANPNVYKPHNLPVEFDVTFIGQAYGERPQYVEHLLAKGIDIRVWGYGWDNFSQNHQSHVTNPVRRLSRAVKEFLDGADWQDTFRRLLNMELLRSAQRTVAGAPVLPFPGEVVGGVLSDSEMIKMYSRSKINLGFSSCDNLVESEERIVQIRLRDFEVPMSGGFYMVEYMEELEEFFKIGEEIVCYRDQEELTDKVSYFLKNDSERERIREAGYRRCLRDHTWHKRFAMVFQKTGLA